MIVFDVVQGYGIILQGQNRAKDTSFYIYQVVHGNLHIDIQTQVHLCICVCSCKHTCMHAFIFEKTYLWILMVQMQPATSNKLSLDSGAGCSSNGEFWKFSRKLDFTFYTRYIFPLRFTSQSVQRLIYVSKSLLCSSSALEVSAAFCICCAVQLESLLLLVRISLLNFFLLNPITSLFTWLWLPSSDLPLSDTQL